MGSMMGSRDIRARCQRQGRRRSPQVMGVALVAVGALMLSGEAGASRPATVGVEAATEGRDICAWQPGFTVADLDGRARAMTVFDDGMGPALYAGGSFDTAGGVTVNRIARWDGNAWSALSGPSGTGLNGGVRALAVYDDGTGPALCAGGSFDIAGGVTVNSIARWDGSGWSAIGGTGMNGSVSTLTVDDDGSGPALYAGGLFDSAGGVTVNGIARWDGTAWTAFSGPSGTGVDGAVSAVAFFDGGSRGALYAGGAFTAAGGLRSSRIGAWGCYAEIFADGFEDGSTAAWSLTVP